MNGLLDIVMLGTVVEFSWLMDARSYEDKVPFVERYQRAFAMEAYYKFMDVFTSRQLISIEGKTASPKDAIFSPAFHHLAVSLYKYKLRNDGADTSVSGLEFRCAVLHHVSKFRPILIDDILEDFGVPALKLGFCDSFKYNGPAFTVIENRSTRGRYIPVLPNTSC